MLFDAFHSVIPAQINVKYLYQHICYGSGPSNTLFSTKSGIFRQGSRDRANCLQSGFGGMNTTRENGSRRVPDDCQNRADTNVNPQNAAPQDSDKSTHSN